MMNINGRTSTCGLIGNPVEHTLSPLIHNQLAQMTGENLVYVPFLVEGDRLKEAVEGAYALHIKGLNVTVPHKSDVLEYVRAIDSLAEKIGAVNTLVWDEGGYKGYNTDMAGLLRAMQTEQIEIANETVLILGAGGAARAVAYLCAEEGAKKVYLCNRTLAKAQLVAREVNRAFDKEAVFPLALSDLEACSEDSFLAIQCTSVGLYPDTENVVLSSASVYRRIHTGVDLIYRPYETKFMKLVKAHGGRTMNGLKMLLYQGIIAYELWNHVSVSEDMAAQILQMMKEEMKIHE